MHKNQESFIPKVEADEVVIKKFILKFGNARRYVVSKWLFLVAATLLGSIIGFTYAYFRTINYTAECTFVMEDGGKGDNGLSQYSGLASMAGIDIGGSGGLFQGENITQLYRSRLMVQKTLLSPAHINDNEELLIDRYLTINKVRKSWSANTKLNALNFHIPPDRFTVLHDSVLNVIIGNINKNYLTVDKPDKKLSLVSVKVKSVDPLFSKLFVETIVSNVNGFYIQTKTKKTLQNVILLQHRADSIHSVLNRAIGKAASASDAIPNPDPDMQQTLRAPSQRRQIDVQSSSAIYAEVIRSLELAKAGLERETPLIQEIDRPVLPLPNDKLSKFSAMVNGGILGFFISLMLILTYKIYRSIMN